MAEADRRGLRPEVMEEIDKMDGTGTIFGMLNASDLEKQKLMGLLSGQAPHGNKELDKMIAKEAAKEAGSAGSMGIKDMVNTFSGMSKAIDGDAERDAFKEDDSIGRQPAFENGGAFNEEIFLKNQEASTNYQNGGTYQMADGDLTFVSDSTGDVVGGDSFERDRVDARLNSGEAVLNVAQQQRLMDLLRGKISLDELGDDDIVEGVPSEYQDDLTDMLDMGMAPSDMDDDDEDGLDDEMKGLKRLIKMLGSDDE